MGYTSYSISDRNSRAVSSGYYSKNTNDIFEQNRKRNIHESMEPSKALLREARDSEAHPNTVPIILALDVTGSMGRVPHYLIKDGLPKIMGKLLQNGVSDPSLLFLAVGDTEYDKHPLQVGQFESGDEELDTWLTRTYIEGGGAEMLEKVIFLHGILLLFIQKLTPLQKGEKRAFYLQLEMSHL